MANETEFEKRIGREMGNKTEFETRNGVNGKLDERRNIIFQRKTRKTGKKLEKQG